MQRSGNNHQQDAPFVGTRHAAISRTKGPIDILTLRWHHGDGQMPPPLNVRLVGASYNMERTGRCYQTDRQTSLAIHVGPDSSIVPHQIPSELLFCHLVTMHTGAGSKRGCDKGVVVPVSARGKKVGSSKTKNTSVTPNSPNSPSLLNLLVIRCIPIFCVSLPEALPPPPTGASRQRRVSATLFPPASRS